MQTAYQNYTKRAALYCRLSRDDGGDTESNSISNQKKLLSKYAEDHGFYNTEFYVDDGWSGSNFNRPGFRAMMSDVDNGEIGTIICKDMSRFGRDYLHVGLYTEVKFPEAGVRFIAVNDGVDSASEGSDEFAPFRNIINEWYCRDISKKIKISVQARARAGEHLGGHLPFGYVCSKEDKKVWEIDEEAAQTVRYIFKLYLDGKSMAEICRVLSDEGVDSPGAYFTKKGVKGYNNANTHWNVATVRSILDRYEYCGHVVCFKKKKPSYKSKRIVFNLEENWLITKNTHEPIIEEETWQIVHRIRQSGRRVKNREHDKGVLNGFLTCADCGRKLYYIHRKTIRGEGAYMCGNNMKKGICSTHYISRCDAEEYVLAQIRKIRDFVVEDEESFAIMVKQKAKERMEEKSKEQKGFVANLKKRLSEIDRIISQLYEDKAAGMLSRDQFNSMMSNYKVEQQELRMRQETLLKDIEAEKDTKVNIEQFIKIVNHFRDTDEITSELISNFVDHIEVSQAKKVDGVKKQDIIIVYNYIGIVD